MKRLLLIWLLLFAYTVAAADIHGTVYDFYLEKQPNVRITINTTPSQYFISKDAEYSFLLNQGTYNLVAEYYADGQFISYASENITVSQNGSFVLDLILFPSFGVELNQLDLEIEDVELNGDTDYNYYIILALLIFLLLVIYILQQNKKNKQQYISEAKDDDLDTVLNFIKCKGGRVTQKDIRKEFPSSEAKISLILTELEHKGKVEKIKAGRSNVIVLK